jgi:hypothetical protein
MYKPAYMPKGGNGCRNCGQSEINKELAQGQHLCVSCLKSLPRIPCVFCTVKFQQLPEGKRNSKVPSDVCFICEHQFLKHGQPSACNVCGNNAAFASDKRCKLCASHIVKFGDPVPCSQCQVIRAFDRPDKRAQHQGRNLCFSCSLALKTQESSSSFSNGPSGSPKFIADTQFRSAAKEPSGDNDSIQKSRLVKAERSKRPRSDDTSTRSDHPKGPAAEARDLEITGLRRRLQEADEKASRLESRCNQLELECQEFRRKHAVSIKELDSYVCAHNMEKYQGKARETEWKNKYSILQAEHSRLKSDFAMVEASVEFKVQKEVSVWRSRVAQMEEELRDVSRELKQLRS